MARVQLVIPDDDQARFLRQARLEGLSFSAWLRAAARERLERMRPNRRFRGQEDLAAFFAACDAAESTDEMEPDWEQHERAIARSRRKGLPET
ncbi:MAG: hypothetical protein OXP11_19535 [Gammaproteobacteria bacterium]|nr:hypothetical protein [Gammaproteobacteria bacterium]MDE0273389.1 hypothetical protein [Gammaproteobacteria bacterium]